MSRNRKKICLINTGGTIGMMPTAYGYAPATGYMEKTLSEAEDFQHEPLPAYDFLEYDPLLDSSNVTVPDWNKLGKDVADRYGEYDGFVILHGTDTMAYTASALSFMLEGLGKPVILTGSQIPFFEVRSDARQNLITAMILAADYDISEVCTYFGGRLMRGNRSTKISSDTMIAFDSPNLDPLAEAGVRITVHEHLLRQPEGPLRFTPFREEQIAVLKIFPGIQVEIFENIMTEKLKGIVLEAFGSGNIPQNDDSMVRMLNKAREKGTHIVVCTQCLKGAAQLGQYETSRALVQAGALCGYDMTSEAAVTKLFYLLSKGLDSGEVRRLMEIDLRGELTRFSV